jgi:hypothetical protein
MFHLNRAEAFWIGLLCGVIGFGVISTLIFVFTKLVIVAAVVMLLVYLFAKGVNHALKR